VKVLGRAAQDDLEHRGVVLLAALRLRRRLFGGEAVGGLEVAVGQGLQLLAVEPEAFERHAVQLRGDLPACQRCHD
jgi:hypothetical protein